MSVLAGWCGRWRVALTALLAGMCTPAQADVRSGSAGPPVYIQAKELKLDQRKSPWHGRYGAGMALSPAFAGASHMALDVDLDLKLVFKNKVFFENGALGAIVLNKRLWRAGVLARAEPGRRRKNLPAALAGLGRIKDRLDGGIFAGASLYKTYFSAEVLSDISGVTKARTINLEGGYIQELSRQARLVPYVRLKWASGRHMQRFFGVDAGQATATNLTPFTARAGFYESAIGALFENELGHHWRFNANATFGLLGGDARRSPITQSRFGKRGQHRFGVKLLRTF